MTTPNHSTTQPAGFSGFDHSDLDADKTDLDFWGLPPTQDALAGLFTDHYKSLLSYTPGLGWFRYDNNFYGWQRDTDGRTLDTIRRFVAASVKGDRKQQKAAGSHTFAKGVEQFAKIDRRHVIAADVWNSDPDTVGVVHGSVNLREARWYPPRYGRRITKRLTAMPEDYALAHYPTWRRFLMQATDADMDLIDWLQRWAGYCLTGHTSEHALLAVVGPGGTGKTTFVNVLSQVAGDYATTAPMSTFLHTRNERHPTDLAHLHAARLVTAVETDELKPWDEAKLKALTGGDEIAARYLYQNFFTFKPQFKLTVAVNQLPALRNPDSAMRRRFRVVRFDHQPTKPDPHLADKLRSELSGITLWACQGALAWYERGLGTTDHIEEAADAYFADADAVGAWIADRCETGPAFEEPAADLWASWRAWATGNGQRTGSQTKLGRVLTARGFARVKRRGRIVRAGIRIAPTQPPAQPTQPKL